MSVTDNIRMATKRFNGKRKLIPHHHAKIGTSHQGLTTNPTTLVGPIISGITTIPTALVGPIINRRLFFD